MNVVIVIPIYKENVSSTEYLSLKQAQTILKDYPLCFICPEGLSTSFYEATCPNATFLRFEKNYFENTVGYSKLLLSASFYHQFLPYDYLLIYQLDAYVFKDELMDWCKKGYDYIGAPWIERPPLVNGKPKVDIQDWFIGRVGNGGLSLRKVQSHYRNTRFFKPILRFFEKNEDMFWGLFLYWLNPFFKRPNWREALYFAFEMNPRKAYELTEQTLPFGVHAWEKYDKGFWAEWVK